MSENLYNIFVQAKDNLNNILTQEDNSSRNPLISRSETISGYTRVNDCMAWAISRATGRNYDDVAAFLYELYGVQGVPENRWDQVFNFYKFRGQVDISSFTSPEYFADQYVVIYDTGNGSHAVNAIMQVYCNEIYCRDSQNLSPITPIPTYMIKAIYKY